MVENINDALAKSQSWLHMRNLLDTAPKYEDRLPQAQRLWNALSLARQRQIFWYLREQKKAGKPIDPDPYIAIDSCRPYPTNWNGRSGINTMMKSDTRMVKAKFKAAYGIYTLFEAQLFEMEDITPLNYNLPDGR